MPPQEIDPCQVVIIGGGFSGVAVAYHLLRVFGSERQNPPKPESALSLILIEPRPELGAGVAYQTKSPHHLLNVRAKAMSLNDHEPESFVRWLKSVGSELTPDDFASRPEYRNYLEYSLKDILARWESKADEPKRFESIQDRVLSVMGRDGGYELTCASGRKVAASVIVLAVGNLPLSSPSTKVLLSPWGKETYSNIEEKRSVAIVGAGLTAIDIVLECEARGFRGEYTILSRHGMLPQTNGKIPGPVSDSVKAWAKDFGERSASLRVRTKLFRAALEAFEAVHPVVDSLRPYTQKIWREWNVQEKRRFSRHLRAYWDVIRHRAPESTYGKLIELKQAGRLKHLRARLHSAEKEESKFRLRCSENGGGGSEALFDLAINGMGLCPDIRRVDSPLIAQLLENGLINADELGMGISAGSDGRVHSSNGIAEERIYTLGSLRRGELWESVAVPELRVQARKIAESIYCDVTEQAFKNP